MLRNSGVRLFAAAVALGCGSLVGSVAHAQNNSGWFVPKASQQQPEHASEHEAQPAPQPVPLPAPPAPSP
ncbi:MAG: OmpH family outer membrane protein, partial [Novacetimonas hansenii]